MTQEKTRLVRRKKRQFRIRKKLAGTADMPRLSIFRSSRHISIQAIDDNKGLTLSAASTYEKSLKEDLKAYTGNKEAAVAVGHAIAARLLEKGIVRAVFDRGGNRYHGRIQALADAVREKGLQI